MPLRLNVAKEKFRVYKKLPKNILRQQGVEVKPPERPVRDIFAGTVMKRSVGTPETLKVRVLKLKLDTYITKVSRIVSYITFKLNQNSIIYSNRLHACDRIYSDFQEGWRSFFFLP